jgi:hypothetical protein
MAIRYSEVLEVTEKQLEDAGAFNGFVDIDSKFYVDPHLLKNASIPELKTADATFKNHFLKVQKLLLLSKSSEDRFYATASKLLIFEETKWIGLGYSKTADGSGIGPELARQITSAAYDIVKAGIDDIEIFELMGLLEDNIGPDRISDMTISIIRKELLLYSQRVATDLRLKTKKIESGGEEYEIPAWSDNGILKPMILIPKEILGSLPSSFNWSDFDFICAQNEAARQRANDKIGNTWKRATSKKNIGKSELRKVLLNDLEVFRDLIEQYQNKGTVPYDFENDPELELIWHALSEKFSHQFPLNLAVYKGDEGNKIIQIVQQICIRFKELIEYNGLNELLFNDNKKPRKERISQRLFYGIADKYCRDNNLDLSPEVNSGRGGVDFKISRGYNLRVCVELKLASNQIDHGYEKQIKEYEKAEQPIASFYIVIKTVENKSQIGKITALQNKHARKLQDGENLLSLIVIDAIVKPSASHI